MKEEIFYSTPASENYEFFDDYDKCSWVFGEAVINNDNTITNVKNYERFFYTYWANIKKDVVRWYTKKITPGCILLFFNKDRKEYCVVKEIDDKVAADYQGHITLIRGFQNFNDANIVAKDIKKQYKKNKEI